MYPDKNNYKRVISMNFIFTPYIQYYLKNHCRFYISGIIGNHIDKNIAVVFVSKPIHLKSPSCNKVLYPPDHPDHCFMFFCQSTIISQFTDK